jgi:large subunit ribosomal protein L29
MKENADKARGLDAAELAKQLRESEEQVFRLRFQMSMGQMEGVKKLRSLRKERARMLTVLRERELDREPAPKAAPVAPVSRKATPQAAKPKPETKAKPAAKPAAAPKARRAAAPKADVKAKAAARPRKSSKG